MKKILLYIHNQTYFEKYREVAAKKDILAYLVCDSDLNRVVEDLFLHPVLSFGKCEEYQFDYLLFQNMTHEELLELMELFQESSVLFNGIKVAYTKTNASWRLSDLLTECEREYFLFMKLERLRELMETCNTLDFSMLSQEQKERLKPDFILAFRFLDQVEMNQDEVDALINRLDTVVMKVSQGNFDF